VSSTHLCKFCGGPLSPDWPDVSWHKIGPGFFHDGCLILVLSGRLFGARAEIHDLAVEIEHLAHRNDMTACQDCGELHYPHGHTGMCIDCQCGRKRGNER